MSYESSYGESMNKHQKVKCDLTNLYYKLTVYHLYNEQGRYIRPYDYLLFCTYYPVLYLALYEASL